VFQNRVLKRICAHKGRKWQETGEDCLMRSFITCMFYQIFRVIKSRGMRPEGKDHLEDLGVGGRIILEWILGKYGGKVWTGFSGSG
jgi:hypothetical protein